MTAIDSATEADEPHPLFRILNRRVGRRVGRRTRSCTVLEAVIEQMCARAMAGDLSAQRELLRLARAEAISEEKRDAAQAAAAEAEDLAAHARPAEPSPFEKALFALGVAIPEAATTSGLCKFTTGHMIPEWVVRAAFAHDPGLEGRLTGYQRFLIDGCMRGWREGEEGWLVRGDHGAEERAAE